MKPPQRVEITPVKQSPLIFGDGYTLEQFTMEHNSGGVVQTDFPFQMGDFRFKHHLSLSGVYVGDEIPVVLGLFHKPSGHVKIFHQLSNFPEIRGLISLPKNYLSG